MKVVAFVLFAVLALLVGVECGNVAENFIVPTFSKEILTGAIGCVNNVLSLVPRFVEQVKQCLPGLSDVYGTKPGQKNENCSWYCQAHACNFLGADNVPDNDMYNVFIDLSVPDNFKEKVKAHVKSCIEKLAPAMKVPEDTCDGAAKFNACIFEVFTLPC